MRSLGANFKCNKPFFQNPFIGNIKVYVIMDPSHMLKLARNCLASKKILLDVEGNEIKWKYIEDLDQLQRTTKINLVNKLTKTHVEWADNKMSVRLAAQTLSESVASSIDFLNNVERCPEFQGSEATTKYIRTINCIFDIMNTKINHTNDKFKRPISEDTIYEFEEYFETARRYLKDLNISQNDRVVSVLKTWSFTPFFGFLHNMTSLIGIYNDYLKGSGRNEFYTYAVSQDHLETYFGCVRRMNGCNDNPTAQQFQAAYRKLLVHNEVTCSINSNCENDITKILRVSSRKINDFSLEREINEPDINFQPIEDIAGEKNSIEIHSMAYSASIVEERVTTKIRQKKKKGCRKCQHIFVENEMQSDSFITFTAKSNKNINPPCVSTVELLCKVDALLKNNETAELSFESTMIYMLKNIDISGLYPQSNFDEEHNHKQDFIKLILKVYFDLKSTQNAKVITRQNHGRMLRHMRLKDTHRSGQ